MERRDFAKRLALIVGAGAAGAVSTRVSADEESSQLQQLYTPQQIHDTVNVLKFGTLENASDAFYRAFIYLNKRGGGNLLVPNGNYVFDKSVKTRIGCKISVYTSSNSIMTMKSDGDMFNITGSENAALRFFGNGEFIYDGPETKSAACIRFVSLINGKKFASSSFECNGRIRIRKGINEWAYGLHLTDVRDAVLINIQFDGLNKPERASSQIGIFAQAKNTPSVSWVISDLQFNDLKTGFHVESDSVPGVEGLKFFNCDMAGVGNGVIFNNNSKYYPPQIELIGCHINGYDTLVSVRRVISIHIVGGLYYRKGSGGSFLKFEGAQDISIVGSSFAITDARTDVPGVIIDGLSDVSAFYRISDCHYWAHGRESPFIEINGKVSNVTLSNSTKDSLGKWVETGKMESPKSSISVCKDTIKLSERDKGDTWGVKLINNNGLIDLSLSPPGVIFIEGGKINKITGGVVGAEYTLVADSGITVNSSANVKNASAFEHQVNVITFINLGDFYIVK
ncbi:hypothetical protein [Raoultella ornithinolytica]|uniref:Uncharacterized protein n=1 Tax=Raoultella ornithinolytica TaxID=54291 RepID=A0A9Q9JFM1_RAOOR|nr:hypothetical protein [Raoultella ornithinolytica]MEB8021661.1 hypothetical protein [Raoultella ornithinolytica]UXE39634.1 hypothetical protein N2J37_07820 [Raoultella ornithinolytica]